MKELQTNVISKYGPKLEECLGKNNYLISSKISIADAMLFATLRFAISISESKEWLKAYPCLLKWYEKIYALPHVEAWMKREQKLPWREYAQIVKVSLGRS